MDDAMTWENKTPALFLSDHEVDPELLTERLGEIKRLGIQKIGRDAEYLRKRLDEWKHHELWRYFQLSWELFCEHELGKPAEWIDLVIQGSEDHDPSEIKLAILQTQERIKLIELKNSKAPDNVRRKSPETIEKARTAQRLRDHGKTQQEIADELGCSQQYVADTLLTTDTSYNITSVGCKNNDVVPRPESRGTSGEYLKAKLRRDCPEVLDEIGKDKKYKSVRAAAIACGIVKPKISIQFEADESGSQIAGRLYQKLSDQQMIELLQELTQFYGEKG